MVKTKAQQPSDGHTAKVPQAHRKEAVSEDFHLHLAYFMGTEFPNETVCGFGWGVGMWKYILYLLIYFATILCIHG